MSDTKKALAAPAQAALTEKVLAQPAQTAHVGRMVITLLADADGRAYPRVEFSPVGMFTPGIMDKYVTYFGQQIQIAQSAARALVANDGSRGIENKESF